MIRYLSIQRLAVIDQLELEFGPGLSVLTGETGAGKSILVEAVGLLLGGRATADLVRDRRRDRHRPGDHRPPRRHANGSSGARSRRRDAAAPSSTARSSTTAALRESARRSSSTSTGSTSTRPCSCPQTQLALLDRFADLDDPRGEVGRAFARVSSSPRAPLCEPATDGARDRARPPRPPRVPAARDRQGRAARRGRRDARGRAADRRQRRQAQPPVQPRATPPSTTTTRPCWRGWAMSGNGWRAGALDPRFEPFVERARGHTRTARGPRLYAARLRADLDRVAGSPAGDRGSARADRPPEASLRSDARRGPRAAPCGRRRSSPHSMAARSPRRASQRSSAMRGAAYLAARQSALGATTRRPRPVRGRARTQLRRARHARHAMRGPLRLGRRPRSAIGPRRASIASSCCLSPNPGEDLRPLSRIASGGELSRVMLAIKTLATTDVPGKTLIFDEVDAGIGGRVADAVGERLRALAGAVPGALHHAPAAGRRLRPRTLPRLQGPSGRPHGDTCRVASTASNGSRKLRA